MPTTLPVHLLKFIGVALIFTSAVTPCKGESIPLPRMRYL